MSWICCQLGSREHYAVPLALHRAGKLSSLLVDTWMTPLESRLLQPLAPALAARRHDGIPGNLIHRANFGRFAYETRVRLGRLDSWQSCMLRISWFGQWCARQLELVEADTVFSYSYNAKWPFRVAKERGMSTVLDLIDGGWMHEIITQAAISQYPQLALEEAQAPLEYWEGLREEIELADRIVVNSAWSKKIWIEAGVPAAKLVEIPLVYERAESAVSVGLTQACLEDSAGSIQSSANPLATRHISQVTSGSRRLQALFLGSVNLTKGVGQLFDATRQLKNEPVEFIFAGPIGVRVPKDIGAMSHVRFLGPVDRTTAERLYRDSDVFLFPTLSDGFGLTQLEALGHGLPVIASTHCGQVVEDRVSGLVLADVTPEAIADAIMQLVRDRDLLARLKANARVPDKCHPRHLAPALLALEDKP